MFEKKEKKINTVSNLFRLCLVEEVEVEVE